MAYGHGDAQINVSLKFEVATHQYYKGGAEGIHIFPKDRMRLIYDTYFYSFKDKMWGVGYDMGSDDANEACSNVWKHV